MAERDFTEEIVSDNDLSERVYKRLVQANGICALASLINEGHIDEIPTDSLPMAMWAARDLIDAAYRDFSALDKKRRNALRTKARSSANAEVAHG